MLDCLPQQGLGFEEVYWVLTNRTALTPSSSNTHSRCSETTEGRRERGQEEGKVREEEREEVRKEEARILVHK